MNNTSRTFEPWVGSHYNKDGFNGIRILILGESHYGTKDLERSSFTREVVNDLGQNRRNRFFTVVQMLITGIPKGTRISNEDRQSFWEQVAFYNFIQSIVGEKSGIRPTAEMWKSAKGPFVATVQELKPDLIVVLGNELQDHLPKIDVMLCNLKHPSSRGFGLYEWQEKVKNTIAEVSSGVQP